MRLSPLLVAAFAFAACSSDPDPSADTGPAQKDAAANPLDSGNNNGGGDGGSNNNNNQGDGGNNNNPNDAGTTDGGQNPPADGGQNPGTDAGQNPGPDAGQSDAGSVDAGPPPACFVHDGSGCPGGMTCVHNTATGPACVPVAQIPEQLGAMCDKALQATSAVCAVGLSCYSNPGQTAECSKLCRGGNDGDCAGLGGTYKCGANIFGRDYGVCFEAPTTCLPYNDTCAAGKACQRSPSSQTEYICLDEGTQDIGQDCSQAGCKRGGVCMGLAGAGNPTCMVPCEPNSATCGASAACIGIQVQGGQVLPFGVCQDVTTCNPASDADCMANETCTAASQSQFACAPSGTAAVGQVCSAQNNCVHGGICLQFQGDPSPTCFEPCDMANACSGTGRCAMLQGRNFGICQTVTACNPASASDCMANQTCTALSQTEFGCGNAGTAAVGQACSAQNNCVHGAICLQFQGDPNPSCFQPCDANNPCASGTCNMLQGQTFGVCS